MGSSAVNWGHFLASWLEGSTSFDKRFHLSEILYTVLVQKILFKTTQQFMVSQQHCRNKSSPLLTRNILCGALLSDTASEPHKAVITFMIAS
jgi:hypothetical protein